MKRITTLKNSCKKTLFYVTGTLTLSAITFMADAQDEPKKNLIGVGTSLQHANSYGLLPAFSLNYERKFTTHSSLESGLRYIFYSRNKVSATGTTNKNGGYGLFTLPVLYKYSSNIVNIAAGPTLNLMSGKLGMGETNPFKKDINKLALGYQLKVGKTFNLTERLVLEPEVSVFGNQYFTKPMKEINIGFKYRF